ncbi:MAG: xanthine dehydrogenase family protein molybdopterin-binding subunit [Chromatiales bacterium]|jgi:aerobic carbon-monoxide dehydrogenase large subunit|nr:xanthine dehydrogenase family protein molybdopterin-binding subunit [Chromatiales bacterium]
MKFALGQAAPRSEDPRLLRGGGQYTDDLNAPGQAWSCFLRSPHAHAAIRSVDTRDAANARGVIAIFTGADIAASNLGSLPTFAPNLVPLTRPNGDPIYVPPHPALAIEKVAFVGDPVAFVIAESLAQARDAADLIEVDYEILDANADTCAATSATPVWDTCADNVCFEFNIGDDHAVSAAFAQAAHVTETDIPISRLCIHAMEPRAAIGEFDVYENRYTLRSGNQFPHDIRGWLANLVLGVAESDIRVISPDMGGSFGLRSNIFPEIAMTLWAAKQIGRPVKWLGDRAEGFMEDHGRDIVLKAALALNADARFTALRITGTANMGAYLSIFGPLPAFGNISGVAGTYLTPAIHARITSVFTNTAPVHPYRGAGRPEATLAIEQVIDRAAHELGMDRAEIRRRNLIPSSAMPYQTPLTYHYDCGDFERNMDQAMALADYAGFEARRTGAAASGALRGFGIANAVEQAAGMFDEGAEIRFDASGIATIFSGVHSHGQGHATVFRQLVSERLGLDMESIRFVQGDTDKVAYGHGTGGSRASGLASTALYYAADRIIEKGKLIAAHLLEAAVEDVEFEAGQFAIAGTDRAVDLAAVAKTAHTVRGLPADMDSGFSAFATFTPPGPTYPNACHTCEVEIDPETGVLQFINYCAVEDVGTVMNPMLLKGQLHGGIVQGLGQVVCEEMVFDDDAQLMSGSLMDYALPRADHMPAMAIESNPVPTQKNPLGIKGVGEAGTVGALAAAMSAVHDALAPLGIDAVPMPATAHNLWRLIRKAKTNS